MSKMVIFGLVMKKSWNQSFLGGFSRILSKSGLDWGMYFTIVMNLLLINALMSYTKIGVILSLIILSLYQICESTPKNTCLAWTESIRWDKKIDELWRCFAVQFNQIIDRDFPQYNADTLSDTLMKKINFPILPNEEERKYVLYCISRVLAGKYED